MEAVSGPRFGSPESYTPKHLAEKILSSKAALEGERKQVTVLFADLKGSMELLADRDPEEARKLLDPVLERMMEAVHRYEGTVNQVMGDGIMALFGAPIAHEDHAVRACYAALDMQGSIRRYAEEVRRTSVPVRLPGRGAGPEPYCAHLPPLLPGVPATRSRSDAARGVADAASGGAERGGQDEKVARTSYVSQAGLPAHEVVGWSRAHWGSSGAYRRAGRH